MFVPLKFRLLLLKIVAVVFEIRPSYFIPKLIIQVFWSHCGEINCFYFRYNLLIAPTGCFLRILRAISIRIVLVTHEVGIILIGIQLNHTGLLV